MSFGGNAKINRPHQKVGRRTQKRWAMRLGSSPNLTKETPGGKAWAVRVGR